MVDQRANQGGTSDRDPSQPGTPSHSAHKEPSRHPREEPSLIALRRQFAELEARLSRQSRRTIILWALDCGEQLLPIFTAAGTGDDRPTNALPMTRAWARGELKMPVARHASLGAHAAAKLVAESHPAAAAAAHALGQMVGTVHTPGHAMGVAMYGARALALSKPESERDAAYAQAEAFFIARLDECAKTDTSQGVWAHFLT